MMTCTETILSLMKNGDILLIYYYIGGIGVGVFILFVLSMFPDTVSTPKGQTGSVVSSREGASDASNAADESTNATNRQSDRWAGDDLPSEALEELRHKLGLTPDQMKTVMEKSRNQHLSQNFNDHDSWTPHQQLNALVYGIMFAVLVHVVNRDYGNIISIWFVANFPKEAAVLGITGY